MKCRDCRFCEPFSHYPVDIFGGGHCRYNPPVVTTTENSKFPVVGVSDWCGKFEAREATPPPQPLDQSQLDEDYAPTDDEDVTF